ncbi:AFR616Wp [Eremothecium gossypii ATCC 10895]|uniref:AFR616Wp n=1 Tax=Eremothecium gossypii (strain ATCC 10895 / CBS 109.51 / FGSC 9923 / NRRL Y-1056) TaxID=284811 RepID=Q752G0_EREGS|nr:AFR616Wp [Eremothecium gossypii ATCC 10895]AAS53987.2 AFR616Wp [Eremothecium gossypii ATCC 10895]AEY98301.1 FAFR616Wp [Eremothecium gossypii FDAG1]
MSARTSREAGASRVMGGRSSMDGKSGTGTGYLEQLNSPSIQKLMHSDASTTALLERLKMSLVTCVEFTKFIRKKYLLEEGHAQEMGKAYKNFFPEGGECSLQNSIHKVLEYDGKLAQVKLSYVAALQKMYDELTSLLASMTKMRKSLKESSRRLEKEVADAIHSAEKAKARYMSLCMDWEKLKLVDPAKTKLTLRGSKTTREQEEDLIRKIDNADMDYKQKVDHSTSLRNTYVSKERPKIVSELKDLILELDTAISIQLQKYTIWTENLILNSGVTIIPFEGSSGSMKDKAASVNAPQDLFEYLEAYCKNNDLMKKNLVPVDYRKHPSMIRHNASPHPSGIGIQSTYGNHSKGGMPTANESPFEVKHTPPTTPNSTKVSGGSGYSSGTVITTPGNNKKKTMMDVLGPAQDKQGNNSSKFGTLDPGSRRPGPGQSTLANTLAVSLGTDRQKSKDEAGPIIPAGSRLTKTFSVPLEHLAEYEQDLVPAIVRQCIYIIDKYGLYLEGIYRRSANVLEVSRLKEEIDRDPSNISMLLPSKNYTDSDIYLVSSLLKTFFASLPDPLLPSSMADEIKTCLSIENPVTRKNFMHGLIYKLPDCQYWTMRALIFHLKRVLDRQEKNRMNLKALCIIWGPSLVPPREDDINDVNYQINTMEVLFDVADQAFEPE